ncbi:MAG TPA: PP2C family serine/threonine-protein phosphatase [Actinomycetota bacterium]
MWRFAAAQATGTSHLRTGSPCQDRLACSVLANGSLAAAVSDGAGSASRAEVGAEIAVQAVVKRLRRHLEEPDGPALTCALQDAALYARAAIIARAEEDGEEAGSYAATLLALIGTPDGGAALQIGDGVMVVGGEVGGWRWLFWPERGEYANTTRFLTDDDAPDRIRVAEFPESPTDIAIMTDGLQSLALDYAGESVHEPFFRGMFQPLHASSGSGELPALSVSLEEFLSSDRVRSRTDDDVALILATSGSPAPPD